MLNGKQFDTLMKENKLNDQQLTRLEKLKYSISFGDTIINYDLSMN